MKSISIEIEGITPLLCNKFGDAAQLASTSGTRSGVVGDRGTPREIAESKLYVGNSDQVMIPAPNLFRAIIDGGKFFKAGKSLITTQKSSMIPACMAIDEIELPIEHTEPWTVDTRAVRIPSTGGRILSHRPSFNDWKLRFTITIDDSMMTVKLLREIIDAAGSRIGLGDFRPACKGPFGKFVVTQWVVNDLARKEAA